MSLFHLVLESEWRFVDGRYTPRRFEADGFVHCCDGLEMTRAVAKAYFSRASETVLVVELNEAALDVPVKREPPAPPDGKAHAHHDGRLFPHVFGSIPVAAVVRVTPLTTLLQES